MSGGVADSAGAADWASNQSEEAADRISLLERLASELFKAQQDNTTVPPLRDRVLDLSFDEAYTIQNHQLQWHLDAGQEILGYKVGLTSQAMQEQLGVDSPDFGFMLKTTLHAADARIGVSGFVAPRVEPELAFVLKHDLLGPEVTVDEARAAIGEIYLALEIIDSRVADWNITLVDTVADNASYGATVLAGTPLTAKPEQLPDLSCKLKINGETKETGTGTAVMGDPAVPLSWLANILTAQGVTLKAGQVILPGSFTRALPAVAGQTVTADYGEFGSVSVHFEE